MVPLAFLSNALTCLRYILWSWLILASLLVGTPQPACAQNYFHNSIVKITAQTKHDGQLNCGTGFIFCLDDCAYIMTAYHVIEHKERKFPHEQITIQFSQKGAEYPVEVHKTFEDTDIAVLKLCSYPSFAKALKLQCTVRGINLGDPAYVLGYEGCTSLRRSNGSITSFDGGEICLEDININPGYSGGPLVYETQNKEAIVVGVFQQKIRNSSYQCATISEAICPLIPEICNPCFPDPGCPVLSDHQIDLLRKAWKFADASLYEASLNSFKKLCETLKDTDCLKCNNTPCLSSNNYICVESFQKIFKECYDRYCNK